MLPLALGLITIAALAFGLALLLRRSSGLPWGRVVAEDVGRERSLQRPLFAERYGLTGKPDYLIEQRNTIIPVEVKPGRRTSRPYESDLMQLAAYCLLVEESSGRAPPYGLLRYANQTFRLDYTPAVRRQLLNLIEEMRALLDEDACERSHDDPRRCAGCGFIEICDDALV